jgi:hypothetical protein
VVTSAVPVGDAVDAIHGSAVIGLPVRGRDALGPATTLASLPGRGYDLMPAADGGLDVATVSADSATSTVWHLVHGRRTSYGSGATTAVRLFTGRAGHNQVAGVRAPARAGDLRAAPPTATSRGTDTVSLDGSMTAQLTRTGRAGPPRVVAAGTGRTLDPGTKTVPPTAVTTAVTAVSAVRGPIPATAAGIRPATATSSPCAVPRLDPSRQVMQPNTARVDWATQLDERGLLTATGRRTTRTWAWPPTPPAPTSRRRH